MTILTCSCCVENQISTTLQRSLGTLEHSSTYVKWRPATANLNIGLGADTIGQSNKISETLMSRLSCRSFMSCRVRWENAQGKPFLPCQPRISMISQIRKPSLTSIRQTSSISVGVRWIQRHNDPIHVYLYIYIYPCNLVGIPQSRFGQFCILYLFKDSYSSLFRSVSMQVTSYPRFPCSDLATCKAGCSPRTKRTKLTLCCGMEVSLVQRDQFPRFWGSQILKFRERD